MKKFIIAALAALAFWASVATASPAVTGEMSWGKAKAYPICDVRDAKNGVLKGKSVFPGQDVLVKMDPAAGRNTPACRMNGSDVVRTKDGLHHRICHNRITRLWLIREPATAPAPAPKLGLVNVSQPQFLGVSESTVRRGQNLRLVGQILGVGGRIGAAYAGRTRMSISQIGGGAVASATGGNASSDATATGGAGGQGGAGGSGYGGNTTITTPTTPPEEVVPTDGNDHGDGDGPPDDPVWPDPPEDGNDY